MKRQIMYAIVVGLILVSCTTIAFADTTSTNGCEIVNLPDRISLTDDPITISSSLQYIDYSGKEDETQLRFLEFVNPKDDKIIKVVQDSETYDDYWGNQKTELKSITLIPKRVGRVTVQLQFAGVDSIKYYKTIYVYDPDMSPADRDIPQNLKVKKFTPKKLSVSWDPVYGAKQYTVFRSKTGKDGTFKKIKTTSESSFTDKGLTSGKTYYYKIKAITSDGISNASEVKKCRVSRKLNITVDMFNRVGRSTSVINVHITNRGAGTFNVYQEFIGESLYYPYKGASYSNATLVNGKLQAITGLKVKKGHTGVAKFHLDTYRVPSAKESIAFRATYDGVAYTIFAYRDGAIFYNYDRFGIYGNYGDDTLYQLR